MTMVAHMPSQPKFSLHLQHAAVYHLLTLVSSLSKSAKVLLPYQVLRILSQLGTDKLSETTQTVSAKYVIAHVLVTPARFGLVHTVI